MASTNPLLRALRRFGASNEELESEARQKIVESAGAIRISELRDRQWARLRGRVTVLTGPNGAGKSTAVAAVLGLTQPTSGRVLIDGVDIADIDVAQWWRRIAWLPQRPALIPGSVRSNLELYGPLSDLDAACRAAAFDEVLATLPGGLDEVIGRGGTGLSLGQRQRLGLARALGSEAPVLLLDEPTAHLDSDSEARVLEAISARARDGATVMVIGHRAPVLSIGDDIVRLGGAHVCP